MAEWDRVPGLGSQHVPHFMFPLHPCAPRKLQHRNLVRLLGVILHHGLYIVMEHVSKVCKVAWVGEEGWPDSLETPKSLPPNRATW